MHYVVFDNNNDELLCDVYRNREALMEGLNELNYFESCSDLQVYELGKPLNVTQSIELSEV